MQSCIILHAFNGCCLVPSSQILSERRHLHYSKRTDWMWITLPQPAQNNEETIALKGNTEAYGTTATSFTYQSSSPHSARDVEKPCHSVRFQVVVWYVGPVDAVLGLVTMKFRVTIFWNAPSDEEHNAMARTGYGSYDASNKKVWSMHGRQRAYQRELHEILPGSKLLYVPPVSILNGVDFKVIGEPEVCLVDEETRAMKWSCMYYASLIQEHMRVESFPHDEQDLVLRLGILKHRQPGRRWDRTKWRISLATEGDSQKTIRVPHGLVVDHVKIPGFKLTNRLGMDIVRLTFGAESDQEECLEVRMHVVRDSSYYDKNIVPLLVFLNIVGISTLTLTPMEFGSRGEILLAIAFVEIGLRLTVDTKLPNVGYQIKMQRILNHFFYTLLFMHVESSVVYTLMHRFDWTLTETDPINTAAMVLCAIYTVLLLYEYYGLEKARCGS